MRDAAFNELACRFVERVDPVPGPDVLDLYVADHRPGGETLVHDHGRKVVCLESGATLLVQRLNARHDDAIHRTKKPVEVRATFRLFDAHAKPGVLFDRFLRLAKKLLTVREPKHAAE